LIFLQNSIVLSGRFGDEGRRLGIQLFTACSWESGTYNTVRDTVGNNVDC
jgi:hypothetical protein